MSGRTIAEKILSSRSGQDARAGDLVVCRVDQVMGTDGSTPMAIDAFEAMGGTTVFDPERIAFALDHYAPPAGRQTAALQARMRAFARQHRIHVYEVGEGIGLQLMVETGRCLPGTLVVGADSHAVMFGATGAFGTGIGSTDLAAAMISGRVWLRIPASIRVVLEGEPPPGTYPKDLVLALARELGSDSAAYAALEFAGPGVAALELEDRLVVSNMGVEMGAKAAIFPADVRTLEYLGSRAAGPFEPASPDPNARYVREVVLDLARLTPLIALPHDPVNVETLAAAAGTPIHMAFLGTCMGGRTRDFRQALGVLEARGGIAPGVQLVITPASRDVYLELTRDGTLARFIELGAVVTTPGCGACCGTAGVIPSDGMNVVSTANRNFKARMGNAAASIFLASPATCAAAAAVGHLVDPRELEA